MRTAPGKLRVPIRCTRDACRGSLMLVYGDCSRALLLAFTSADQWDT